MVTSCCIPISQQTVKQARILIIDDNLQNIKLLLEQLKDEGFCNLTGEVNSRRALEVYFTKMGQEEMLFDLILLDIMMPGVDGFGVIDGIRSNCLVTPILALTARQDQDTRNRALEKGVSDFITRPFNIKELVLRIEVHLKAHFNTKRLENHTLTLDSLVYERTKELEQANQNLTDNYYDMLWRMALMAEFRDNETALHMKRMGHYSILLAKAVGMNVNDAELLLHTAPLHDIGKVDTPDNILLKPGKLNSIEWTRMKNHAETGWIILKDHSSSLIQGAAEIAYSHHEKWDGSGYPQGIKGEDIPLSGRIIAIADVFDALMSRRPYKEPWPLGKVLELLQKEKDHHFEPQLVDQFIRIVPQTMQVNNQYQD